MATKWFLMVCDLLESKIKQKSKKFGFGQTQFLTIPQPTVITKDSVGKSHFFYLAALYLRAQTEFFRKPGDPENLELVL